MTFEQAPAADPVLPANLPPATPGDARRWRTALVLAAVVVVVLALVVSSDPTRRPWLRADRRAGNWNAISRVDLPANWEVKLRQVSLRSESSVVGTPVGAETNSACTLQMRSPGISPRVPGDQRHPVRVNGRPGFSTSGSDRPPIQGGVYWNYSEDGWAQDTCTADRGRSHDAATAMARRVVFEPTPLRLPFRLHSLPAGYAVEAVGEGLVDSTHQRYSQVRLSSPTPGPTRPDISISVSPGTAVVLPGQPGYEQTTVAGLPAVLSATDARLCLDDQGSQICIEAPGGQPADLNGSWWPAGRRELLLAVADQLRIDRHLDDPSRWPDANEALPS